MSFLPDLQLLPVKGVQDSGGAIVSNTPAVQAMVVTFPVMTAQEKTALYMALADSPGPAQQIAQEKFVSTWAGLGVGLVLGVAGLMVLQHLKGE